MATKTSPTKTPLTKKPAAVSADPSITANKRILAARAERIVKKELAETLDLGLNIKKEDLKEDAAQAAAVEFLRDEWDRKAFGDEIKTFERTVYGPDPIVNNCPEFHERLEKYGLEAVAEGFRELIMTKGEMACPDAVMRKGVRMSILRFGKEATADAFRDRILRIPSHVVQIETDTELDPMLSNPMREAVEKYLPPGMAAKFLSDRCNDVLGMRGYEIVKKPNGDPVKVGTLFMGMIPQEWADRRREHFANLSIDAVREQEESYFDRAAEKIRSEGLKGATASILQRGESTTADPRLNDEYLGDTRPTGITLE